MRLNIWILKYLTQPSDKSNPKFINVEGPDS